MFIELSLVLLISVLDAIAATYDDITTEVFDGQNPEKIGWIKILSCSEGANGPSYINPNINSLLPSAYTFRISPPNGKSNPEYDNFAVILKPDSILMSELSSAGERPEKSISWLDWIGTNQAKRRVKVPDARNPSTKFGDNGAESDNYYFWANGNGLGIHVTSSYCYWAWNSNLGQDLEMYLGYHDITIETFNGIDEEIRWTKIVSCNEGYNAPSYIHPNIKSLVSNAYTFRISPPNGTSNPEYNNFAVILKPGTTLMNELNNNGERPESSSSDDWIGSSQALERVQVPNPRNPYSTFGDLYYFWANGNGKGIHVQTDVKYCFWQYRAYFGQNVEMYVGYKNN